MTPVASQELHRHVAELQEATGLTVELAEARPQVLIVLRGVSLPPSAYQVAATDALFVTDVQYPLSAMDMFWTEPSVLRADGSVPQSADVIETYLGRQWRRFSWHRNGVWDPARNGLLDHYEFMLSRFVEDAKAVAV